MRVMIEQGKRKAVAVAFDWPGLDRAGATEPDALARLATYRERYAPVAALAGLAAEFAAAGELEVVERITGVGTTDFWGISAKPASAEVGPLDEAALERKLTLLGACWTYLDGVAARVSAEMARGPRGGGRDRDQIWRHVIVTEEDQHARKLGVRAPREVLLSPDGNRSFRAAYLEAFRAYNARGLGTRTWELQFLLRRSAYHAMDHAWEMEDKDLTDR